MMRDLGGSSIRSVVIYSPYQWTHALVTMRIARPIEQAGVEVIAGNVGSDIHPERVEQADAIVIQREFVENQEIYDQILTLARAVKKPVIYEIDDLLFELPKNHIDYSTHYYTQALLSMLRAVIEADLVTTSTLPLQQYLQRFNPRIELLPNYLDDKLWAASFSKQPGDFTVQPGGQTTIGYMGSNTHEADLQTIAPILARLLDRYQDQLRLKFWSIEPPIILRQHPRVEWIPIATPNYAEFASYFSKQKCDLFVAPLIDSPFNRCKSGIKCLEYSSLGIPGVFSSITPYQSVIQDGINGFLAASEAEWEDRLVKLIESPALRARMGKQAYQTVQDDWLLSRHTERWVEAYERAWQPAKFEEEQETRQGYLDALVGIARQMRDWQNMISAQLSEKDQIVAAEKITIRERELQISELQAQNAAQEAYIQEIHGSRGWKVLQAAWRFKSKLFG